MDDAKIHSRYLTSVQVVGVDGDGGGDGQPEPAAIGQQGERFGPPPTRCWMAKAMTCLAAW